MRFFHCLRRLGFAFLAVWTVALSAGAALAADYFVAVDGSDEADGASPATAFATIGRGLEAIRNPGDRVVVAPGEYAEGDLRLPRGGTSAAPVAVIGDFEGFITGAIAGDVVVQPPANRATGFLIVGLSNVAIEGFTIRGAGDAAIQVRASRDGAASSGIELRRNVILDGAKRGIDVTASGAVTVLRNRIIGNGSAGISLLDGGDKDDALQPFVAGNILIDNGLAAAGPGILLTGFADAVVQGNRISGSGTTGVTLRDGDQVMLANNLVYANGAACSGGGACGDGLAIGTADQAVQGAKILNNTLYANNGWGVLIGSDGAGSTDALVINNIFSENVQGGVAVSRASTCGYVSGFNLFDRDGYGPGTPANVFDLRGDPAFANPAVGDFLLLPGSPAIDAGSTATAAIGLGGSAISPNTGDPGTIDLGFHEGANPQAQLAAPLPYMPIFVRPDGDDVADGRSPETALATPSASDTLARAGVTVVVAPGRYVDELIGPGENRGRVAYFADSDGGATDSQPGPVVIEAPDPEQSRAFVLLNTCGAVVDGFTIAGGSAGIQVRSGSDGSQVRHNTIFGVRRRAIDVAAARGASVVDNLLYVCGGGVQVEDAPDTRVTNNTLYANDNIGVLVRLASPCTRLSYNVVDSNGAVGFRVEEEALPAIVEENVNTDGYTGVARPPSDFDAVPQFVDPPGADGILGGVGFADDRFQVRGPSPAVDLASIGAAAAHLDDRSTRLDGVPDSGALDAGFHYPSAARDPRRALSIEELDGLDDTKLCASLPTPKPNGGGGGGGGCTITDPGAGPYVLCLLLLPLVLLALRGASRSQSSTAREQPRQHHLT